MAIPPQTLAREHRVQADGLSLAVTEFRTAATGTAPLVLLHGIGSRGASWWPVIDALAGQFSLYVVDLRGHGGSEKPVAGYRLPDYAADLKAILNALKLDYPAILGHSLGGLIALAWALDHPEGAAGIVLEDTSLRGRRDALQAVDGWLALNALTVEEATAYYAREHPTWDADDCRRRAETITGTARGVFVELRQEAMSPDAPTDRISPLGVIRSPVLLLRGEPEAGSMVAPEDADRFADSVPLSQVIHFPRAGHSIHRDDPDGFLAAVMPFLLSLEGAPGSASLLQPNDRARRRHRSHLPASPSH